MFPTTPQFVEAFTADRYRDVERARLIAAAAAARTPTRRTLAGRIETLFRRGHRAPGGAQAAHR
jgi:hypothetical protein